MLKAIILAAGYGTRLKPITNHIPKALVEINGIPLLEIIIKKMIKSGIKEIIINTHYLAEQVVDFVRYKDAFGIKIEFSHEEEILDTGGGIKKAAWFLKDSDAFIVHNVDIISSVDFNALHAFHRSQEALVTLAISKRPSSRYFLFNASNILCGWGNADLNEEIITRKKEDLIRFGFSGIHCISSQIFDHIHEEGKFSIIPTYLRLSEHHRLSGYLHDPENWIDVGTPEDLNTIRGRVNSGSLSLL